jgi:hypothetical protein
MQKRWSGTKTLSWLFAITLLGLGGCAAPQYDAQTDKLISTLQSDVDTQLVSLISLDHKIAGLKGSSDSTSQKALAEATTKAGYDANSGFYDKIDVELTSLALRVDAAPNDSTARIDVAIKALRDNLLGRDIKGSLQNVHLASGVLDESYLTSEQGILNTQFQALLTYELVLKNGSDGAASTPAKPATTAN